MPVRAVCPECGATTTIDDDTPKKVIECRQCGKQVPVPGAKPGGPPPLPKKDAAPADAGFEVLDDEEEEPDDRPPVRSRRDDDDDDDDRPRPRGRSRDEDEEDDEDFRPVRSRRLREQEDEDEDEDDRPRSRRRRDDDEDEENDEDEAPRRRPAARGDDEDEDEDDSDRSRTRSRRAAAVRDDEDEDDEDYQAEDEYEEDDSIPRRRPGYGRSRDDEEDEDDEVEQRPRKRGLILLGLLAFVLLGAGGGVAAYYFWPKEKSEVVKTDDGKPPAENPPVVPGPKPPDPKPPEPKLVEPPGLPITPVKFDGDRKSILLPGKVTDTVAGGEGRYIFLNCPDEKKLCVYDASQASVVKEIPTAGADTVFAAGATQLLLADNSSRKIERYDLLRLEKDKEGPFPFAGKVETIALGSGSHGPALVVTSPAGAWPFEFLDVETLEKADVGWKAAPANNLPRAVRFAAAAGGSRWAGVPADKDPRGAVIVDRDGKQISARWIATDKNLGYVSLSADGRTLCSRAGATDVSMPITRPAAADTTGFVTPSVTGPLFVHVRRLLSKGQQAAIRVAITDTPSSPSPNAPRREIPPPYQPGDPMPPDRHIYLVPESQSLVICPTGPEGKLEVLKFNPLAGLPPGTTVITSTPPATFTTGSMFAYKVRFLPPSNTRSFQMMGPKGATIRDGIINWTVPPDEKEDSARFDITLTTTGKPAKQSFVAYNTATPAPRTEPPKNVVPKVEPKTPTTPEPKKPAVPPSPIAPGAKLVQESSGRLPIAPPDMKEAHVEVDLPGPIRDACIGGGGRYIIFHCPTVRKLVVFDVTTLKVKNTIPLHADDILFAAGMEKLFVIYPDLKAVIRVSLADFRPEADKDLEVTQRPTVAAMGSATAGPLVLGGVPSQNDASKMALTFIDLATMKEVAINKAEGTFSVTTLSAASLRVSANGQTLGAWRTQLIPSGLQVARLAGNTIGGSYVGESVGHVTPGPDGQAIFTDKGMYTTKCEPTGRREAAVPAVQGNWFVTLAPKGSDGAQRVSVWGTGKNAPLAEFNDLPGFDGKRDPFERDNPTLALDRRLFLVPDAKILIVVPPAANKLHVYRVEAGKK